MGKQASSKAKQWTVQGLLGAAFIGLGVTGVMTQIERANPAVAAQAESSLTDVDAKAPYGDSGGGATSGGGLDPVTYSHAVQVRQAAGLSSKDLAAIGLTEKEATSVLTQLVSWCEQNEKAIAAAQQKVNRAQQELREIERLARIGEATQQELADAQDKAKAVVEAKQACDELLKQGAMAAIQAPGIPADKVAACQRASKLKAKTGSDVCYLSRMDERRIDDLKDEVKRQKKADIEEVLSYSEDEELKTVRSRIRLLLPGVARAEQAAMPTPEGPEELIEEEWDELLELDE